MYRYARLGSIRLNLSKGFAAGIGYSILPTRYIQSSPILAKKVKQKNDGKVKNATLLEDVSTSIPEIDFKHAEESFQKVIDRFNKLSTEAKLGKTSPSIFDKLLVHTDDGKVPFKSVAQTSVKGRNFVVTVFDPIHTKNIINAVLGSELNMNPQIDPANNQTLKIPLPPVTTESKGEVVKHLRADFEKFKNGPKSLASIRAEIRHKFQKSLKKKKPSDEEEKALKQFENLHKEYLDKLSDVYRTAEKAILK